MSYRTFVILVMACALAAGTGFGLALDTWLGLG